jgi:hypothetical protein
MLVYGMSIDTILQCSIVDEELSKVLIHLIINFFKEKRSSSKILSLTIKGLLWIIREMNKTIFHQNNNLEIYIIYIIISNIRKNI